MQRIMHEDAPTILIEQSNPLPTFCILFVSILGAHETRDRRYSLAIQFDE